MNYRTTATFLAFVLVLAIAAPGRAQCPIGSKEYIGPGGGDWNTDSNWEGGFKPTSTDDVCIPPGPEVILWAGMCDNHPLTPCDPLQIPGISCPSDDLCVPNNLPAAVCNGLEIQAVGTSIGSLRMSGQTALTVNGVALTDGLFWVQDQSTLDLKSTVTINGDLKIENMATVILHDDVQINNGANLAVFANEAVIQLEANLTITGDGGEIKTNIPYLPYAQFKSGTNGPYTLTLAGVNNAARSTSLTLRGNWGFNVPVINNAYVLADDDKLVFHTAPVSGTGVWMADELNITPGELILEVAVTGSAEWRLQDDPSAKITLNADSTGLSGDFNLETGTLAVNADVTTTGNLDIVSLGGTLGPKITVVVGKKAIFGY